MSLPARALGLGLICFINQALAQPASRLVQGPSLAQFAGLPELLLRTQTAAKDKSDGYAKEAKGLACSLDLFSAELLEWMPGWGVLWNMSGKWSELVKDRNRSLPTRISALETSVCLAELAKKDASPIVLYALTEADATLQTAALENAPAKSSKAVVDLAVALTTSPDAGVAETAKQFLCDIGKSNDCRRP